MIVGDMSRAQRAGAAVVLLLLIGVGLVIALILSAARGQDRIAAEKSVELVRAALAMRQANTAVSVKDYAWWTDAVRKLVDTPDAGWAYEHIGRTTYESIGVTLVAVIDASDKLTFTFFRGAHTRIDLSPDNVVGLGTLIAAARAAPMSEPIPISGFVSVGDQVYSVSVAALTVALPEEIRADEKPRSVLVFGRLLDTEAVAAIAADHRIRGLTLVGTEAVGQRTSYQLTTADGTTVGALAWAPERPGNDMIRELIPPVGATITGLAALSLIIIWQIRAVDGARRQNEHHLGVIEAANRELISARDEAQQANRVKSQFLAVMSHELRTPLNAIIGFSEIMQSEIYGPLGDSRYKQYLQDIQSSGDHLLSIINDILDLSKIESGRWELQEEDIDLSRLLTSVRTFVQARITSSGLSFDCDKAAELPTLRGDRRALMQILLNLLSNAIKFTPKGGRIALRAELGSDNCLRFTVSDTGIGIAAKDIARALSTFGQVDDSWSRRYEGAGLGLPISRALVRLHGGTLDLTSQPGVGTTVTIHMPPARTGTRISMQLDRHTEDVNSDTAETLSRAVRRRGMA